MAGRVLRAEARRVAREASLDGSCVRGHVQQRDDGGGCVMMSDRKE